VFVTVIVALSPEVRNGTDTLRHDMDNGFELRRTAGKGEGVFATRLFEVGDTVMVGRILRVLDDNHAHATQSGLDKYVLYDRLIPKVNHSCQPNCGVRRNKTGAEDLAARTRIEAGQEITLDYAMRNYSVEHFPTRCACGETKCRGRITGWKDLPAERKADYAGYVSPYLLEIDGQRVPGR
jgi:hypothetical protein